MTYAARRSYGRIQTASTIGAADTVIARRPERFSSGTRPLPQPSPQSASDGQPDNEAAGRRWQQPRAQTPPAARNEPPAQSQPRQRTAAAFTAPRPGKPADFDGEWEVAITYHFNGEDYRYVEDVTVENGKFNEYLDVQDIRLGQHVERNWILEGAVDGDGKLVESLLHYAHVRSIIFNLDGTLKQAEGTTPHKSWTVSIRSRKKK
jgi:hypothetical protein